jgi:hypothetical protein
MEVRERPRMVVCEGAPGLFCRAVRFTLRALLGLGSPLRRVACTAFDPPETCSGEISPSASERWIGQNRLGGVIFVSFRSH